MLTEIVHRVGERALRDRRELRPRAHWGDFVLAEGFLDVFEASGDHRYLDGARAIIDAAIDRGPDWGRFTFTWAGLGLPALRLHAITESKRYGDFGMATVDRLRHRVQRTNDGGITHDGPTPQLWIDLLHFVCPTFAEAALHTGDGFLFDEAVHQLCVYNDHLLDEPSGHFYHVWDESNGYRYPELWARGGGWLTVACVETLARLPADHDGRAFVLEVLGRQLDAICQDQDPSGLWHTVINRPDSYIETSTGAIFGLPMARGARLGFLDRRYLDPAARAWRALQDRVSHDGLVFGVSTGTPPGDFAHYQGIATGIEPYGTGLFLQFGVEMSRL